MRTKHRIESVLYHVLICGFGFIMIYPVLWMISGAFKNNTEILNGGLSLIPEVWRWENFVNGWSGFGGISFGTFFKNSLIVAGVSTFGTVISSACVAYAFSRIKFKGSKIWFTAMLCTMMLPAQIILVPQYIIFNGLNWVNTFLPLTVPEWGGRAFFIFLIMQFIAGIPKDLDEAAEIDGCGKVRLFTRVMMPLIKPALATSAIFSFYWKWDDFMGSLLYLNSPEKYTVSIALKLFCDPTSVSDYGAMFAMCVASLLPVIVLFLFTQKYIVDGIAMSGLKA